MGFWDMIDTLLDVPQRLFGSRAVSAKRENHKSGLLVIIGKSLQFLRDTVREPEGG